MDPTVVLEVPHAKERYVPNSIHPEPPTSATHEDFRRQINRILRQVCHELPPRATRDPTVYTGAGGIALAFYWQTRHRDGPERDTCLHNACAYVNAALKRSQRHGSTGSTVPTFLVGDCGPLVVAAAIYADLGRKDDSEACLVSLREIGIRASHDDEKLPNELLYGRAGFLSACLIANQLVRPDAIPGSVMQPVVRAILEAGKKYAQEIHSDFPLMWSWHESDYLGAAHGVFGILYTLLSVPCVLEDRETMNLLRQCLDKILHIQMPGGNFPTRAEPGPTPSDRLVHWCHGAPGAVFALCKASAVFGDERYRQSALRAGEVVWWRGLLKKGLGLCHGISGNAYALLALHRETGDDLWLHRAYAFARFAISADGEALWDVPNCPCSLYEGLCGAACLLHDMAMCRESARFPGFEV